MFIYNQKSPGGIFSQLRMKKKRERDREKKYLSLKCKRHILQSLAKSGKKRWISRFRREPSPSPVLAVNQEGTRCQLCVATCCAALHANRRRSFLLRLPHPRKVFFRRRGSTGEIPVGGIPAVCPNECVCVWGVCVGGAHVPLSAIRRRI